MSCLPKPILRGHNSRRGFRVLVGAITFGSINASLFCFFQTKAKYAAYENFLKTYNPEDHYNELIKYGIFRTYKSKDDD